MAKIIYWNVENKNRKTISATFPTLFQYADNSDIFILSEITSVGKGIIEELQAAIEQYGQDGTGNPISLRIQPIGGTTSFGNGESIALFSTVGLDSVETLNIRNSNQSRYIVVIEFFGGLKIATFHLSSSNTAQKTAERQQIIKLLAQGEIACAIGDWNTEPQNLQYRKENLEILLPDKSTTVSSGKKFDYAVINTNLCNPTTNRTNFTKVLSFFGSEPSNHFPIQIDIIPQ